MILVYGMLSYFQEFFNDFYQKVQIRFHNFDTADTYSRLLITYFKNLRYILKSHSCQFSLFYV